jgi:predicted nucleic acid-binding protein
MSDNNAFYLDTSALAKWYLSESRSEEVSAYIVG